MWLAEKLKELTKGKYWEIKEGVLPAPLKRRDLLYLGETPPEILVKYGDMYFERGLIVDAFEFYKQAHFREGLERIKEIAIEEGDVFLLGELERAGLQVSEEERETLHENARKAGKFAFLHGEEEG